jgi:hypothetical protein
MSQNTFLYPNGIEEEAEKLYNNLFDGCSLEHGKTVSKAERQVKNLTSQKVRCMQIYTIKPSLNWFYFGVLTEFDLW